MKLKMTITSVLMLLAAAGYAFAEENADQGTMMMGQGAMMENNEMMNQEMMGEENSQAVEVGNKICPVSGEEIPAPGEKGDMGEAVKYEYNGKIYNFCCPMCIKDFKNDPEKYSKVAEDEVKNANAAAQEQEAPVQE